MMLGAIPPSIHHVHGLYVRNLSLPLMIAEWDCDVLVYIDIHENAYVSV